jgi:molybdate transport system regulatory protein
VRTGLQAGFKVFDRFQVMFKDARVGRQDDPAFANRCEQVSTMRKSAADAFPLLSVRIDLDPEGRIGPGKIQLLENIHATGSISAAGRAMEMSYKRAWDLVDELNRICGRAAVERQTGGKNGGGANLTPFGLSLVERYRKIERAATTAARKQLTALKADIGKPRKS